MRMACIPPEELERDRVEAGVVDRGEPACVRVLDGRREPLLEYLVCWLRADHDVLRVVEEHAGRLAGRVADDDAAFDFVWEGLHGLDDRARDPERVAVLALEDDWASGDDRIGFQGVLGRKQDSLGQS